MPEPSTDRQVIKLLFSNPTSRNLLAIWARVAGSRFPIQVVCDLLGSTEDILDPKLQSMAGIGLVHVSTDVKGGQNIEFLANVNAELVTVIEEFLESRKGEFETVETKVRSLLYITLLNHPA